MLKSVKLTKLLSFLLSVVIIASVFITSSPVTTKADVFSNFITRSGDKLYDGSTEFKFMGLQYAEAMQPFGGWEEEARDFFKTCNIMGVNVVRTMPPAIYTSTNLGFPKDRCHIINAKDQIWGEEEWGRFDKILNIASEYGIRIIIPFFYSAFWGNGKHTSAEFARYWNSSYGEDDFYNNSQVRQGTKNYINYVLNRINTVNGTQYKNDKTILCWETSNEAFTAPYDWTVDICSYIKSIDGNHLVMDGSDQHFTDNCIDLWTKHYYNETAERFDNLQRPIIIGEWGNMNKGMFQDSVNNMINGSSCAGGCYWLLEPHGKTGGFIFWPQDQTGGNWGTYGYTGNHWPGFKSDVGGWSESEMLSWYRSKAYQVRNLPIPAIPVPDAPKLFNTDTVKNINWFGSAGAEAYDLQRSASSNGPWETVGYDLRDCETANTANVSDDTAVNGTDYYYRITAKNSAGESSPSNVIGPIKAGNSAPNLALNKSATNWAGVDGNEETTTSFSTEFKVDLGSVQTINKLILKANSDKLNGFYFQYSTDNNNFHTIMYPRGFKQANTTYTFDDINARYVRIMSNNESFSIKELEIYDISTTLAYKTIKCRWTDGGTKYLYDNGNGRLSYGNSVSGDAYKWEVLDVNGYKRIKNKSTHRYIAIEHLYDYVECMDVNPDWHSKDWVFEDTGSGFKKIKCRWTDYPDYINVENQKGYAQHGSLGNPDWYSAQWIFEAAN